MPIPSTDGKYVTVESGDTLGKISADYFGGYSKYPQLAAINNISNPHLIYVGQKIWLSKTSSSSSSNRYVNSNTPVIDHFGLQSDSENTLFAMWTWNKSNTESYQVKWEYATADGVWFVGSSSSISVDEHDPSASRQSTYSIPSNATKVRFKVKPISKKRTVNEKEVSYWTANWSSEKVYDTKDLPPTAPSGLKVTIVNNRLTAELDNLADNAEEIQFQIVKNNTSVYKTGKAKITTGHASYSCEVELSRTYKVRCRAVRDGVYSDWSEYSENIQTVPATPPAITVCRAYDDDAIYLSWNFRSINATSYNVEYALDKNYFDASSETTPVNDIKNNHYIVTGLETGKEYFFRIQAVNDAGVSGWSPITSVVIGTKPSPPTTWSSSNTIIAGNDLTLYWVHNSTDGSRQTVANIEIYVNDNLYDSITIEYADVEEEDVNSTGSYVLNTSEMSDGDEIAWKVQTTGISDQLSDWSLTRVVDVYDEPTVEFGVTNQNGELIEILTSFPFHITAKAGPKTQRPISYYVYIISNDTYETVDQIGNTRVVNVGEEVYSNHFYISNDPEEFTDLLLIMSPGNVDLENNVRYTAGCIVSMDSGLTAEGSFEFVVSWIDQLYQPNAEIIIDQETLVAHIRPYCEESKTVPVAVTYDNTTGKYELNKDLVYDGVYSENKQPIGQTETGEYVYEGYTADSDQLTNYAYVTIRETVEDVTLAVYRREYDGKFVELATGLSNSSNTFVTDPHPALDYARYRIVATTNSTGAVSYYDLPGYSVGGKAVVIQWDENWSNFDVVSEDAVSQPPWSGSMLKLSYNIDTSTTYNRDVSLIEYVGREHPVAYHGTQVGETESWNVEIPKTDIETLYALRRLAKWQGDVYVREPSGSGYWANISVSFSQKHTEVIIPISIDITRIEGGA